MIINRHIVGGHCEDMVVIEVMRDHIQTSQLDKVIPDRINQ